MVLVLLVIALLMAVAAPSLRGWSRGSKLRDAAEGVLTATRYARSQAISAAAVHRLEIDRAQATYRITKVRGTELVPVDGSFGQPMRLSSDFRIDVARVDANASGVIEFFPNGRVTPARIRVTASWGEAMDLEAQFAAEPFHQIAQVTQ
jgi:Tfp pilus assembly protein FimT